MIREPSARVEPKPPIAWVSYTILLGSVIVFGADALLPEAKISDRLGLFGPEVLQGQWWRPFTCVFVHGGLLHIVFNMSAVLSLGRVVELNIGSFRFLIASLVGAMGSALAVLVWKFEQRTVGASGVILAWAGALLPIVNQAGRKQLGVWLAQVALISLLPQVSGAGHLGGFLFGLPCGWLMRRPRQQFQALAPVLIFLSAILLYLAGSGRLHR